VSPCDRVPTTPCACSRSPVRTQPRKCSNNACAAAATSGAGGPMYLSNVARSCGTVMSLNTRMMPRMWCPSGGALSPGVCCKDVARSSTRRVVRGDAEASSSRSLVSKSDRKSLARDPGSIRFNTLRPRSPRWHGRRTACGQWQLGHWSASGQAPERAKKTQGLPQRSGCPTLPVLLVPGWKPAAAPRRRSTSNVCGDDCTTQRGRGGALAPLFASQIGDKWLITATSPLRGGRASDGRPG